MRYRMTVASESSTRPGGTIKDPQGPAVLGVTWDATIRLEVSAAQNGSGSAAGPVRLRITYESSQATVHSDVPEPRAAEIQRQYAQLAGRSLEFTLAPGGQVSDIRGLEGLLADERSREAVQQWIVAAFRGIGGARRRGRAGAEVGLDCSRPTCRSPDFPGVPISPTCATSRAAWPAPHRLPAPPAPALPPPKALTAP